MLSLNKGGELAIMEAVRQIIDSSLLSGVVSLPRDFQNKKVELIVLLSDEKTALPSLSKADVEAMLEGSVTESLIGALPGTEMSIDEYRSERLKKYEYID